jgi:catechol 2,3-dioxygenase-like lactoylglutathione lyase family enzyme
VTGKGTPGVTGLHHTAVCVTDIAVAKRFYGEVLGLREIDRPAFPFAGAWYELGDGRQLHLIVHEHPRTLRGTRAIDLRDGHFALGVTDFDEAVAHLRAAGVECVERPDNVTPWQQVYVTDPDGNVIELNATR